MSIMRNIMDAEPSGPRRADRYTDAVASTSTLFPPLTGLMSFRVYRPGGKFNEGRKHSPRNFVRERTVNLQVRPLTAH